MLRAILNNHPFIISLCIIGLFVFGISPGSSKAFAESINQKDSEEAGEPWYREVEAEWGGHFILRGAISWPDDESLLGLVDAGAYHDGNMELR